jgi:hypothetical protein
LISNIPIKTLEFVDLQASIRLFITAMKCIEYKLDVLRMRHACIYGDELDVRLTTSHRPHSTQLSRYTSYRRRQQTTTTMTPVRPRRCNAAAGSSSNPSSDDTVPHPLGGLAVR